MLSLKRIVNSPAFQTAIGATGASYLRLVWRTTHPIYEPPTIYETVVMPAIIAMWHGQHFMTPFFKLNDEPRFRAKVLISRHRDGEINAIAAERLGIGTIRGSGAHSGEFHRKGGVTAFSEMLEALDEGYNVALTADVPKIARVAGMGIVKLGQLSGRPIYATAMTTQHRIVLNNWDRSTINLPFGRIGIVGSEAIYVPRDADEALLEEKRKEVERALNRATEIAYAIADGTWKPPRG